MSQLNNRINEGNKRIKNIEKASYHTERCITGSMISLGIFMSSTSLFISSRLLYNNKLFRISILGGICSLIPFPYIIYHNYKLSKTLLNYETEVE